MPCFYCGKPISLVRRLTDPDFCSEEHRRKYHDLTRMALNRLVETRDQLAAAAPKRRRPRGTVAVEPPQAPVPPVAGPLDERVGALAIAGHLSFPGESASSACAMYFPHLTAPPFRPAFAVGLLAPAPVSGPRREAVPPAIVRAPLPHPAPPAAYPLYPRALPFPPVAGPPAAGVFFGSPSAPLRAPAKAALVAAPAAALRGDTSAVLSPPIWQPQPVGYEALVAVVTAPPPPGEPAALPVPRARPPERAAAAVMRAGASAPALAAPRRLEVRFRYGLSVPALLPARTPCVEAPVGVPMGCVTGFPAPGSALPGLVRRPAVRIAASAAVAVDPARLEKARGASPEPVGWRVATGMAPVGLQRLAARRVATVGSEATQAFELARAAAPPRLTDALPLRMPETAALAARAITGPPQELRPRTALLPRTAWAAGTAVLGPASLLPAESLAGRPGAMLPVVQPAPAVVFPVGRPLYIGWAAMRLRRALGSGEAVELKSGEARAGLPALRETPAPGFRIAAWAFTHAPGVVRVTAPAVAAPAPLSAVDSPQIRDLPFSPRAFDWAAPVVVSERPAPATLEAYAPVQYMLATWQREMAGVRALSVRLPRDRVAMEAAAADRIGTGPVPPLAPRLAGPSGAPAVQPWAVVEQGVGTAGMMSRFPSVDLLAQPSRALAPPSAQSPPAGARPAPPAAFGWPTPLVRPHSTGIAPHVPFRGVPPTLELAVLPQRVSADARSAPAIASMPAEAPATTVLPSQTAAIARGHLPVAPPAAREGLAQHVRTACQPSQEQPPVLSGLAMPASTGGAVRAGDLFRSEALPVEPAPRNQAHAARNQPKELPLAPLLVLQIRPCLPVPHRFERLPVVPRFAPVLSVVRFLKALPLQVRGPVAALLLLLLAGAVLWYSGVFAAARESVRRRAAIVLTEDFSSGTQRWTGGDTGWSREPAGSMLVGSLALLRPSLGLSDYRAEFMGEIEQQSLAWVIRARDLENYYAMKIVVLRPGPLPTMALVRYEVLGGKAGPPVQVPLRVVLQNNAPFRVQVRLNGTDFTTLINAQIVDFWGDDRLKSGGIGFFSEEKSRARLYWVRIVHQDDWVGNLCAYLAPNNIDSRNGSWR